MSKPIKLPNRAPRWVRESSPEKQAEWVSAWRAKQAERTSAWRSKNREVKKEQKYQKSLTLFRTTPPHTHNAKLLYCVVAHNLSPLELIMWREHRRVISAMKRKTKSNARFSAMMSDPTQANNPQVVRRKRKQHEWYIKNRSRILERQLNIKNQKREEKNAIAFFQALNTASEITKTIA